MVSVESRGCKRRSVRCRNAFEPRASGESPIKGCGCQIDCVHRDLNEAIRYRSLIGRIWKRRSCATQVLFGHPPPTKEHRFDESLDAAVDAIEQKAYSDGGHQFQADRQASDRDYPRKEPV